MSKYREILIWESNDVKLLGITIDKDLKLDKHVLKLCSKVNQKSKGQMQIRKFHYMVGFI